MRLSFDAAIAQRYTDAEVNDYAGERHVRLLWRPPLRLHLRARASQSAPFLLGTAGFGFWNAPFVIGQAVRRLPEAVWFFYTAPPTQLALVPDMPAYGWKAQVVHTQRWGAVAAGIPTLATVAWARMSGDQRAAARWVQRLSGTHEAMLAADLAAWHDYRLDWTHDAARFFVDDVAVCHVPQPPHGPLAFVAWIDNQYIVVTPRAELRSGVLATGPQWLEMADVTITPLG